MLTQLLGPNRHTAHEQQKPGANWKTRQREGLCPGETPICSTLHRHALQEVLSPNTGHYELPGWHHIDVLACI